jgi:hypothetical protein
LEHAERVQRIVVDAESARKEMVRLMIACTHEKVILIQPSPGGVQIRTAKDLMSMLTDLILNSGEHIALWAEIEAKRCADVWRQQHDLDLEQSEQPPEEQD